MHRSAIQVVIVLLTWRQIVQPLQTFQPSSLRVSGVPKLDNLSGNISGDVIIGGLFSIRRGDDCEDWASMLNIRRAEAMLFAIDQINANDSFLPRVHLGAQVYDDCFSGTVALEQSLNFVLNAFGQNKNICNSEGEENAPVVGVVGTGSSGTSLPVASFLRLFRLPQVSFSATSPDLSNREDYDYFMRVVPSDLYQVQAMLDVTAALNWTAVYLFSSVGNYGQRIMEAFVHHVTANKTLCIVGNMKVGDNLQEANETLLEFLQEMNASSSVRGVVLLTETFHTKFILENVKKANISRDRFLWLGSDTWGTAQDLDGVEDFANGAITIALHVPRPCRDIVKDFDEYFKRLRPGNNSRNPWFDYFWQNVFQCFLPGNKRNTNYTKQCKMNETYSGVITDDKVPYILDAVYAFAHSLNRMLRDTCPMKDWGECSAKLAKNKRDLLYYLREVNFSGATGMVSFDAKGNGVARYDITSYVAGTYKKLATWYKNRTLHLELPTYYQQRKEKRTLGSSCSQQCSPGEERAYSQVISCCWTCRKCPDTHYVNSLYQCQSCGEGNRTNRNRSGCEPLPMGQPAHYVGIILAVWATLGLIVTSFVAYTMYKFYSTPIVMATGRELMLVLLVGIALCHILGFALLGPPTFQRCGFQRFGSGLFLAVCYSAILVKTNRIARIFRGSHRPAFITPAPQLLITALLVFVQVGISVAASIFGGSSESTTYYDEDYMYVVCRTSGMDYVMSISYNVLLLLLCTCYAFLTRKLPANFNEAKKIGITMYATCVLWICFLPLFYGTNPIYQTAVLLLNSCFNATVLLSGMFGNMVYVVWFRPEKNTRQASNPRGRASSSQSVHSLRSLHMDNLVDGTEHQENEKNERVERDEVNEGNEGNERIERDEGNEGTA